MKKLLALLLLSPFVAGEDTEYPIELTCVGGIQIVYIHLTKNQEGSWFKVINPQVTMLPKHKEIVKNRKFELKKYDIDETNIAFKKMIGRFPLGTIYPFKISRKTGQGRMFNTEVVCSRGIKEFNKNII
jgi:hypothetical protein|tara:strand:+ start:780 stop:1166 length:387 start_codon:yes stop_codon:yes gene_type:complete